jgi:hypothetical protein
MRSSILACLALAATASLHAQTVAPTRGQLLYSNHCGECHSTQMHWREQRLARDWETLKIQVRRFQGIARLDWSDDDIEAVARHLNDSIYRFPQPHALR